ncbi:Metallo-dependent phosphatase-like protein [Xylariaceae sp. FL0594]|nr:Metallo-dependent phosphatase-like protein [Xylariaceae sp. FL0594]
MAFKHGLTLALLGLGPTIVQACSGCYGPAASQIEHVRHTDTHGWLEGHLKEKNYGADWGDFVTFSKHLKRQALLRGVDLLLVDTGDLHDGAGLSDVTSPDGKVSITIFDDVDYDLLSIGNHELYLADVAYQTLNQISAYWGDKYLTSNVQIMNQKTGTWEYIGKTHRYFTTKHGLRIMAFGVLFDFTGNTNVTQVFPAKTMVTQKWFTDAIHTVFPIDVFVLIGHNPVRSSSFQTVVNAIRAVHPNTPIQILGGHSHIRDFVVYDQSSVALESGRYCETLGWLSMSGFSLKNSGFLGFPNPIGLPNPTRKATNTSTSPFKYSRRYLDWNRRTFEYHAATWYDHHFDTHDGLETTAAITKFREEFKLDNLLGCVPQDYCISCVPFGDPKNIYTLLSQALGEVVVNPARAAKARYIIANTGSIRFDMYKGPFTYDDSFIVSPFQDVFLYIPDVPFAAASVVLNNLNHAGASEKKKRDDSWGYMPVDRDICVDPVIAESGSGMEKRGNAVITRRQIVDLVPGYTTTDDFGTDGDDTVHARIPYYKAPDFFQGAAGFDNSTTGQPDVVDLIFLDFIEKDVLKILGSSYSSADVNYYIDANYTTRSYLPDFVKQSKAFQADVPNCPTA